MTTFFNDIPLAGSKWKHKNGNTYTVSCIANFFSEDYEKYPPTVVYTDNDGKVWAVPLSNWHNRMTKITD